MKALKPSLLSSIAMSGCTVLGSITLALFGLALFLFEVAMSVAHADQPLPASTLFGFRSLYDYSVVVTNAVFEKELFLEGIPKGARKQVFSLKLDGQNYILGTLNDRNSTQVHVLGGRFESYLWEANPNYLMIYDQRINSPTSRVSVVGTESIMRMTADLFINLGITEMVRGSVVWVKDQNRITAQSTKGENMIVEFEGAIDAPTNASIRNKNGEEYAYVRYTYNSDFCGAKIPSEFTRFHSGAPSEDVGKMFTVHIKKLELIQGHIPPVIFDPQKSYHFERTVFYSNDVLYWKGKGHDSELQRVLTAEEASKSMSSTISPKGRSQVVKIATLGFFGVSIIGAIMLLFKKERKKDNEKSEIA